MSDGAKPHQSLLPGKLMAPPVYRPQARSKAVQAKTANGATIPKRGTPSVYRPQQAPKALQAKISSPIGQGLRPSDTPPFRSTVGKAVQPKTVTPPQPPIAPRVYRPQQQRMPQPKMASMRSATIQAVLSFDSNARGMWQPDRQNCSLCTTQTSWGNRHHCRVCGRFVCNACGGQKYQVRNPYTQSGRSASAAPSTERVCVDCVLNKKIALAARVPEFQALAADALQGAANRAIAVNWARTGARAFWSGRNAMITIDPTLADPFSTYVFELTNAANDNVHAQAQDFPPERGNQRTGRGGAPRGVERFAFHTELVEYTGTMRHDRVVQAINAAALGFTATRYYMGAGSYTHFAIHMRRQEQAEGGEPSHTGRYRQQHQDYWDRQPKPPKRRQSL